MPPEQLQPSQPFSGVGGGPSDSLGQIRLPVTFRTRDNFRTELVNFDIARIGLSHNAILGYPALAQFMAATHPGYNLMKMPGSGGVLTVAGDTKEAFLVLKFALKLGRNAEAYVDDIMVKSREAKTLIQDLEETFTCLREVDLQLNPEKCVFGVPSGKLLGFLVSHKGIKANPEKVKLMKKKGPFEWTPEADEVFQDLHRYLNSPPVMVAPRRLKPPVLYLAATPYSASAALVAVREERRVKAALCPATAPAMAAQDQEGLAKATASADGVQPQQEDAPRTEEVTPGHPIKVVSAYPLERVLRSPNSARRVTEWNIELQAFQLEFSTTRVIKGAALADFVAEWTEAPGLEAGKDRWLSPGSEAPNGWVMYFDGAFSRHGAGASAVLVSPTQDKLYYAVQLYFQQGEKVSNNIAEYEGLIAGLRAAATLGVKRLIVKGDSKLPVNFSKKVYEPRDEHMEVYLAEVCKMEKQFLGLELQHVPRGTNQQADDIARRASRRLLQEPGVFEERLFKPSAAPLLSSTTQPREQLPQPPASGAPACGLASGARLLLALEPQEGCWTAELKDYLTQGTLLEKDEDAERIHQPAQGLQTIPLSRLFAVWGLDILGPFPWAPGGYRYLYVASDKFTKWAEVEAVCAIPDGSAVKFIKGLICYASVARPRSNGQAECANAEWRVHRQQRLRARANVCQPRARATLPAAEIFTATQEALLQQPSAWSQSPPGAPAGSSLAKKRGSSSQLPVGSVDHTTNSGSTSAE
ncbi:uncharacterized protein [Aegilops tauschii subsp. strangulata]|uniref:uncharacterized protein n=1 Tax=Aegilops tauschii subsp. strangulata TaxID=200361 RepID=UPI001ABC7385|nr:uncharacterized protein LOC109738857 [Aegilops tauschii subsp. strangulata]